MTAIRTCDPQRSADPLIPCSPLALLPVERWYSDGLGRLSLEVSISCAALSLISQLVNWRVGLFSSGAWAVQRQLQILLLRKYLSMDELDLKVSSTSSAVSKSGAKRHTCLPT